MRVGQPSIKQTSTDCNGLSKPTKEPKDTQKVPTYLHRNLITMLKRFTLFLFTVCLSLAAKAQCNAINNAFQNGELLQYDLFFNWKFVWVKVGTASWHITQTRYNGKPAYRTTLSTKGSPRADKYFIFRNSLSSYVDTDLVPLYYQKESQENKTMRVEKVWYSYPKGLSTQKYFYQRDKHTPTEGSTSSKYCAFDMLSMLLRARSFNTSNWKPGHRIPFLMAEGKGTVWREAVYRGKKNFQIEGRSTTYRCLVFSYMEKENGKEKEIVKFYITDDANHLPVRIDMNLNFGTAKAYLTGAKGVRNPQTAKIKN